MKYYNTDRIRAVGAHYNFVIGERSNGKTTALLRDIIEDWYHNGKKGAIVRQMEEDIKGHKGASLFNGVCAGDMVSELTNEEWTGVKYRNRAYYLTRPDERDPDKIITQDEPFAHIFAVSQSAHYKSNSYPNIGTIMFDEFINIAGQYLVDEVVQFLNLVSTIVREKDDATIFLIANTVSWNAPYFTKFGLREISKMKPGELATVDYQKDRPSGARLEMKVAVEYCEDTASHGGKASDVYFVIDDERVAMITEGSFAIPSYPRCPISWKTRDVKCTYWFDTESGRLRGRLIRASRDDLFIFVDRVPEEVYDVVADERRDLFYSLDFSSKRNHLINPARRYPDPRSDYLADALEAGRMFFTDNAAGEDLMYYCGQAASRSIAAL